MAFPWQQTLAVSAGVLLSLILNVWTTENPARVPFRRVWCGALPGLALFFGVSVLAALIVSEVIDLTPEELLPRQIRWCVWLLTGLLVSQSPRLKDRYLSRRIAKALPGLFFAIQAFDERSRLALVRLYREEERRASFDWLQSHPDGRWAVDHLFEINSMEIAIHLRRNLPSVRAGSSLTAFRIRHEQVKIKLLFRLLGLREALTDLTGLAEREDALFRNWSPGVADRRGPDDDPSRSLRRRKYEQPGFQRYVLGELGADPDDPTD